MTDAHRETLLAGDGLSNAQLEPAGPLRMSLSGATKNSRNSRKPRPDGGSSTRFSTAIMPLDDLAHLERDGLGSERVAVELEERAKLENSFTRIADVLLCMRSRATGDSQQSQSRRAKLVAQHKGLQREAVMRQPPHLYGLAACVDSRMRESALERQAVVIVGEEGGGMPGIIRDLLFYWQSGRGNRPGSCEPVVLHTLLQPLVSVSNCNRERDGDAWCSTRGLVSVELGIDEDGVVTHATATVKLLEISRVQTATSTAVCRATPFDAFYLVLSDPTAQSLLEGRVDFGMLDLPHDASDRAVLDDAYVPFGAEQTPLEAWTAALLSYDVDPEAVIKVICGILLLSEVCFISSSDGIALAEPELLQSAANVLGLTEASTQSFKAAFFKAASADDAEFILRALIQELYRGLVNVVTQAASAKFGKPTSGAKAASSISISQIPSCPSDVPFDATSDSGAAASRLTAALGSDALVTQWLAEAVRGELPVAAAACSSFDAQRPVVGTPTQRNAQTAISAIVGDSGILRILNSGGSAAASRTCQAGAARKRLINWSTKTRSSDKSQSSEVTFLLSAAGDERRCKISGLCGSREHHLQRLASDVAVRPNGSNADDLVDSLLKVLKGSTAKFVVEVARTAQKFAHSASRPWRVDTDNTIRDIQSILRGEQGVRPWLICSLEPSRGSEGVSRDLLLQQTRGLGLADIIHFCHNNYCVAWPTSVFAARFESNLQEEEAEEPVPATVDRVSVLAKRIINRLHHSAPGAAGAVGQTCIYATAGLQQALETIRQRPQWQDNQQVTKEHHEEQRHLLKQLHQKQLRDIKAGTTRQLAKLHAEQHAQLDEQHRTQLKSLFARQQTHELDIHEGAEVAVGGGAASKTLTIPAACQRTRKDKPVFDEPKATLHAALSQMAVVLRVAKEGESKLHRFHHHGSAINQDLHNECNTWRLESDRLGAQVEGLRKLVKQTQRGQTEVVTDR